MHYGLIRFSWLLVFTTKDLLILSSAHFYPRECVPQGQAARFHTFSTSYIHVVVPGALHHSATVLTRSACIARMRADRPFDQFVAGRLEVLFLDEGATRGSGFPFRCR